MGVVKNLMVRIVTDATGLVGGMREARTATSQATGSIKESVAGMRKSVKSSFGAAQMSVREYSEYVGRTRENHAVAVQNTERLTDKLDEMRSTYQAVKTATAGLDLSKPLEELIVDAEKTLTQIESKARKTEKQLAALEGSTARGKTGRTTALREELRALAEKSKFAQLRLEHLNNVADRLGSQNIRFASDAGLKKLEEEIRSVERELKIAQGQADATGRELREMGVAPTLKHGLRSIGTAAVQALGGGISRFGKGLKKLGSSAVRGIASIPGKLLNIGKNAAAGTTGLNRMVRSIRNLGVVSLGLRVAQGMFGRLRSIVSEYISKNEALNASVTSLKNQMGQALAPAINIVIAALQRLMPVVNAVANAINSIFSAIFGNVTSTAAAVTSSAEAAAGAAKSLEVYGFDQITKVSDDSGGGSGSGSSGGSGQTQEQSALVSKLTGWIQQLKDAFTAGDWVKLGQTLGDGINKAIDSINATAIGATLGQLGNNLMIVLYNVLTTTNFTDIGKTISELLNRMVWEINWSRVGQTLGEGIKGMLNLANGAIQNFNWLNLGRGLRDTVANIDWGGISRAFFSGLGGFIAGIINLIGGAFGGVWESIKSYFAKNMEACGGSVISGLIRGILYGFADILSWIYDNIVQPFIDGFKRLFGIHSPSTVMAELGGFLIQGLLNGLTQGWKNVITFISDGLKNIRDKFADAWNNCRKATQDKWTEISTTLSDKLTEMRSGAAEKLQNIRNSTTQAWGNCLKATQEKWAEMTATVATKLDELHTKASDQLTNIRTTAAEAWKRCRDEASQWWTEITSAVSQKLSEMRGSATENFQQIGSFATRIWETIQQKTASTVSEMASRVRSGFERIKEGIITAFEGAWNGVKGWINKIIGGVEKMVNYIISGVNNLIQVFNSIAQVGEYVGLDLTISEIPPFRLPRLATGGIATGATAAVIGEAGKEAVLPLEGSNSDGWMTQLAQKIVELSQNSGAPVSVTIPVYVGGKKITDVVIKDINQITRSTGKSPLLV